MADMVLLKNLIFLFFFLTLSCAHIGKGSQKQRANKPSSEKQARNPQASKEAKKTLVKAESDSMAFPIADSHFHTKNYIQEGLTLDETYDLLSKHGVQRAAVFGIPLQQKWNMHTHISPSYYLHDDQALYYYSAIDAFIAVEYQALPESKKKLFDPMIVGFNPTDGRAVDHIRNMLLKFPNTFSGIGEFSIKKEIVSGKIYGEPANLEDPALGKILTFAQTVGLVVILHCDVDAMISNNKLEPTYLKSLERLFKKHRNTKIIWAHAGLGRYVKARPKHLEFVRRILSLSSNFFIDISWDQVVQQFFDKDGKLLKHWKDFLKEHSRQIVFGSDSVAPTSSSYKELLNIYQGVWKELPQQAVKDITYLNYKRLFDSARLKVRLWEKNNLKK
ncbi:MAG: amidohydrolase family protein [Oligoflexia bacterium]|nr:amidohydrolase family protein [Oligoflexia bacterium]